MCSLINVSVHNYRLKCVCCRDNKHKRLYRAGQKNHTHTHKSLTLCDWVPVCLHEKSFKDKQNTFAAVWGKIRGSGKVMEESVSVNYTNYLQLQRSASPHQFLQHCLCTVFYCAPKQLLAEPELRSWKTWYINNSKSIIQLTLFVLLEQLCRLCVCVYVSEFLQVWLCVCTSITWVCVQGSACGCYVYAYIYGCACMCVCAFCVCMKSDELIVAL